MDTGKSHKDAIQITFCVCDLQTLNSQPIMSHKLTSFGASIYWTFRGVNILNTSYIYIHVCVFSCFCCFSLSLALSVFLPQLVYLVPLLHNIWIERRAIGVFLTWNHLMIEMRCPKSKNSTVFLSIVDPGLITPFRLVFKGGPFSDQLLNLDHCLVQA